MKQYYKSVFITLLMSMMATRGSAFLYEFEEIDGICYSLDVDMTAEVSAFNALSDKHYSGNIIIPESIMFEGKKYTVTAIGPAAFSGDHIESVSIPETVTRIEEQAFSFCTELTTITIPNGVTYIGYYAFECSGVESVTIGDGVTLIDNKAFSDCQSLTSVTIGKGIEKIGKQAFEECKSVVNIICKATTPPTCGSKAFEDIDKEKCIVSVPKGCYYAYSHAEQWWDFKHINDDYTAIHCIGMEKDACIDKMYIVNGCNTSFGRGVNIIRMNDGSTRKVVMK